MFNKTETLQIRWGRNERWQDRTGAGFTSGRRRKPTLRNAQGKAVKGGKLISRSNREAARKAAIEAARLLGP